MLCIALFFNLILEKVYYFLCLLTTPPALSYTKTMPNSLANFFKHSKGLLLFKGCFLIFWLNSPQPRAGQPLAEKPLDFFSKMCYR